MKNLCVLFLHCLTKLSCRVLSKKKTVSSKLFTLEIFKSISESWFHVRLYKYLPYCSSTVQYLFDLWIFQQWHLLFSVFFTLFAATNKVTLFSTLHWQACQLSKSIDVFSDFTVAVHHIRMTCQAKKGDGERVSELLTFVMCIIH